MWRRHRVFLAFGISLLAASVVFAVGETSRRFDFFDNAGGLNDKGSPVSIDDDEAADLQNVVFETDGAIRKRDGESKFNTRTLTNNPAGTGLFYFRQTDGDDWLVKTTTNAKVFTATNVAGLYQEITGAATWTGSQNVLSSFDAASNVLLLEDGDGTTPPWQWNPDDTIKQVKALGGSPPDATMLKYHKNHLFVAGDSSAPSQLSFSNLGAIELWDAGDKINVETNDGSPITALWVQLDGLYIGKRSAIFRLDGTSRGDFQLQRMVAGVGPVNHQSVAVLDNVAYFVAPTGHIYRYDGGITTERVSDRITRTIDGLNLSRTQYAIAGLQDRSYWVAVTASGGSTHNRILLYDVPTDSWTKFKGINANAMAWAYDPNDQLQFYTAGYAGYTYLQRDTNADDGQAIAAYWASKWHRFAGVPVEKILRWVKLVPTVEGNWNLSLEVRTDFEATGTSRSINLSEGGSVWNTMVWNTDTWGGRQVFISAQPIDKKGEFFQVRFANSNADEPFTVRGYSTDVDATGRP